MVFASGPIEDYRGYRRGDMGLAHRFNELLLERGIPKGAGKNYISTVHTEQDVSDAFDAWSSALDVLASERTASAQLAGAPSITGVRH